MTGCCAAAAGARVRVPEARFVGPAILCADCERALTPCPEAGCGGRLMEITAGPGAGGLECSECKSVFGRREVLGPNVIQFPGPLRSS